VKSFSISKYKGIINLKSEILLVLRKKYKTEEKIYPKLLSELFNKSKSAISQHLKDLAEENLILFQIYKGKKNFRKHILLTDIGYKIATFLIFQGLNSTEIQALKALNLLSPS